ncbi:hypothetical protein D3C74_51130 [compost metagenome]
MSRQELKTNRDFNNFVVETSNGDYLSLDLHNNSVSLSGEPDYATFIRMVKELKRFRNRESMSLDYFEE